MKNSWNRNFAYSRDMKKKNRLDRSGLILLQSLALYFAIMYGWQLSDSESLLFGKKNLIFKSQSNVIHMSTDFFTIFLFCLINACLPCVWCKVCVVLWATKHFIGSETPKHNVESLQLTRSWSKLNKLRAVTFVLQLLQTWFLLTHLKSVVQITSKICTLKICTRETTRTRCFRMYWN